MILTFENKTIGQCEIKTNQGNVMYHVGSIGIEPHTEEFESFRKFIEVYRLPGINKNMSYSINYPLNRIKNGINPIYIRVVQEDGNIAWTSPIYIKSTGSKTTPFASVPPCTGGIFREFCRSASIQSQSCLYITITANIYTSLSHQGAFNEE